MAYCSKCRGEHVVGGHRGLRAEVSGMSEKEALTVVKEYVPDHGDLRRLVRKVLSYGECFSVNDLVEQVREHRQIEEEDRKG